MQASRSEKARLGMFLLMAFILIGLTVFFLIGRKLVAKTVPYYTRFEESVTGLEPGSPVKQNGVDIGSVTALATDSVDVTKTIVRFSVPVGTAVKTDMGVAIGTFGITGLKYIDMTGGSYSSPDVPPGGEVRSSMSTLGRITLRADSIAFKIDRLLGNAVALTDISNRQHFNDLIQKSARLSEVMDSLVSDVQALHPGQRLGGILDNADAAMRDMRGKIRSVDVAGTVEEYRKAAVGVNEMTGRLDLTIRRMQEDLLVATAQLKETMKNMNTFSRQIKENPAVLLRGEDKQERAR